MLVTLLALSLGAASESRAVDRIEELSLDDLLSEGAAVAVTSSKSAKLRDSPGVVTVMHRDDIEALGVRDLAELLPFVPGFDLGTDTFGTVGASFRGLWGYEGKILFLLDGIELNETGYGNVPLFGHYSLDDVERVEFLRGPGSARYGGFAELAVVNIVTRGAAARRGVTAKATYGQAAAGAPFKNESLTVAGGENVAGVDVSAQVHLGARTLSLRDYESALGETIGLDDTSGTTTLQVLASATTTWLKARLFLDRYDVTDQTGYVGLYPRPGINEFRTATLDVELPLRVSDDLQLTPHVMLQRQLPWRPQTATTWDYDDRNVYDRARVGLGAQWAALRTLTLSAGAEVTGDNALQATAERRDDDLFRFAYAGDDVQQYVNGAVFGELALETPLFTLTAGARGEQHSVYGGSFVPRVALTRAFDGAHVKLLVAGAFKAPTIDNISSALAPVTPERTGVLEAEAGVRVVDGVYVTVNAFDVTLHDTLLYTVVPSDSPEAEGGVLEGFVNGARTSSRGIEATLLGSAPFGRLELAWSYASPSGKNQLAAIAVPGDDSRFLGMAQQRLSTVGTIFLVPGVTATVHAVLRSERAAVTALVDEQAVITDLPASVMLGGTLRVADVVVRGGELVVGVRNLLQEPFAIAQPFSAGHAPLPYDDTEFFVRLGHSFGG